MEHAAFQDPALTIALAAAAGMLAQTVARHVRVPGIVLLLGTGLLLGPDGLGVVRPGTLGGSLHSLVGFAVAVILFEGGMNLSVERLRREKRSIRQLVTLGALVTAAGAALAARLILEWSWELSILFGTLVMVTGPTVITPLLRRKVKERVATVLEAEGILVDAIGAITAVVALEVVISSEQPAWANPGSADGHLPDLDGLLLPLAVQRGRRAFPMDESVAFRAGDRLYTAAVAGRSQEIAAGLREAGWEPETA